MPVDLIIDGYNLMHFAGLVRSNFGPGGFERARNSLLKRLQKCLSSEELARTTVVFDGRYTNVLTRTIREEYGIEVIYSPKDVEADDVIEDLIIKHHAPKQLVIISSDNRLSKAARRRRAGMIDSETYVAELERREEITKEERNASKAKPSLKQSATLSEADLEEWLEIFEAVDPLQISAELKAEQNTNKKTPFDAVKTNDQTTKPSARKHLSKDSTPAQDSEGDSQKNADKLSNDPLINDVSFWQQRIDDMYREEDV